MLRSARLPGGRGLAALRHRQADGVRHRRRDRRPSRLRGRRRHPGPDRTRGEAPLASGHPGLGFWNRPGLTDAFRARLTGPLDGHRTAYVRGRT
ncbi:MULTISPECIES: hypothetical protein [Streptomyces]|uniref:Uncharacterized protein n=1 Tax=Streptomyces fimbriatus TaxID=68197 RepID=A0ABW0DEU6_STRFI